MMRGSLLSLVAFLSLVLPFPARADALSVSGARVVYRADAAHGWVGWHSAAWSILNGKLTADGQRGEIRLPYVPARHGLSDYRVTVYVAQDEPLSPPTAADPYPPVPGFAIRVRRVGPGGYGLHAYACDYAPCLVLRTLPAHLLGIGNMLAETGWEEGGDLAGSAFVLQVRGTHISGSWTSFSQQSSLHLRVKNRRYRQGGFISLYVDPGVRLTISRVVVTALP